MKQKAKKTTSDYQKLERKIVLTKKILEKAGFDVNRFKSGSPFHLQAKTEYVVRNIRVTLRTLSESEMQELKDAPMPSLQGSKEIATYYKNSNIPFFDKI